MPAAKMNSVLASIPIWRAWAFAFNRGPVAQLGARFHGMEGVVGRSPRPLPPRTEASFSGMVTGAALVLLFVD